MTFHCLFWTVRILCCDDTTTRALFAFSLSFFFLWGFYSCFPLTVYISYLAFGCMESGAWEHYRRLTGEASQAAKFFMGLSIDWASNHGWDGMTTQKGTNGWRGAYRVG